MRELVAAIDARHAGGPAVNPGHIAGHRLLRGDSRQTLHATFTHGLPPDGVHSPRGFLVDRLIRHLPPDPEQATPPDEPERTPVQSPEVEAEPEPDGPVARIRAGEGIHAVLEAALHRP